MVGPLQLQRPSLINNNKTDIFFRTLVQRYRYLLIF